MNGGQRMEEKKQTRRKEANGSMDRHGYDCVWAAAAGYDSDDDRDDKGKPGGSNSGAGRSSGSRRRASSATTVSTAVTVPGGLSAFELDSSPSPEAEERALFTKPDPDGESRASLEEDEKENEADEWEEDALPRPFSIPMELFSKLFPYQRDGVAWMYDLHTRADGIGGILADEMGLGKTVQVISFVRGLLESRIARKVLIVMPLGLLTNWHAEFLEWSRYTNVIIFHGSTKNDLRVIEERGGVCLTTYGTVKASLRMLNRCTKPWDYLILDEGHLIKNYKSQNAQALRAVKCRRKLMLSGTPLQNNLKELWALFAFLSGGKLLGSYESFRKHFELPINKATAKDADPSDKAVSELLAAKLRKMILPYFMRREKRQVFLQQKSQRVKQEGHSSLQGVKVELVVWIRPTPLQLSLYRDYLKSNEVARSLKMPKQALVALKILQKICNDARMSDDCRANQELKDDFWRHDPGESIEYVSDMSGKLQVLVRLLSDFNNTGNRALIFCQSVVMLDFIEEAISSALPSTSFLRMDGSITDINERRKILTKFQKRERYRHMLLSSKMGLGITVTAADRVIIFDPSWNPSQDAQAVDRAFRVGQTKDVIVYRFVTCGTLEEKIYRNQIRKDFLARTSTLKGNNARYFSKDEVRQMFVLGSTESSETSDYICALHPLTVKLTDELVNCVERTKRHDGVASLSRHDDLYSSLEKHNITNDDLLEAQDILQNFDATKDLPDDEDAAIPRRRKARSQKRQRRRFFIDSDAEDEEGETRLFSSDDEGDDGYVIDLLADSDGQSEEDNDEVGSLASFVVDDSILVDDDSLDGDNKERVKVLQELFFDESDDEDSQQSFHKSDNEASLSLGTKPVSVDLTTESESAAEMKSARAVAAVLIESDDDLTSKESAPTCPRRRRAIPKRDHAEPNSAVKREQSALPPTTGETLLETATKVEPVPSEMSFNLDADPTALVPTTIDDPFSQELSVPTEGFLFDLTFDSPMSPQQSAWACKIEEVLDLDDSAKPFNSIRQTKSESGVKIEFPRVPSSSMVPRDESPVVVDLSGDGEAEAKHHGKHKSPKASSRPVSLLGLHDLSDDEELPVIKIEEKRDFVALSPQSKKLKPLGSPPDFAAFDFSYGHGRQQLVSTSPQSKRSRHSNNAAPFKRHSPPSKSSAKARPIAGDGVIEVDEIQPKVEISDHSDGSDSGKVPLATFDLTHDEDETEVDNSRTEGLAYGLPSFSNSVLVRQAIDDDDDESIDAGTSFDVWTSGDGRMGIAAKKRAQVSGEVGRKPLEPIEENWLPSGWKDSRDRDATVNSSHCPGRVHTSAKRSILRCRCVCTPSELAEYERRKVRFWRLMSENRNHDAKRTLTKALLICDDEDSIAAMLDFLDSTLALAN
ncbi:SNF2 family N-terminal domain-containing protein [Zopfochytrium polystomum]|nr:SNF2 family N-terminal domain-containing protein [Zopfochytrium polystomum]